MEFLRQEDWSGLLFPAPGDLPLPGAEPMSLDSPALQTDFLITVPRGKPQVCLHVHAYVYVYSWFAYLSFGC